MFLPTVCFLFFTNFTAVKSADSLDQFSTKFSGYTFIEAGEVMKGVGGLAGTGDKYDHRWMSDACFGLFSSTRIDNHLNVLSGFEGLLTFPYNIYAQQGAGFVSFRQPMNLFWVSRAEGMYSFGDTNATSLQIEAGYFPYKYNNEVRNLGEYMFRTYCYPTTMINQFDRTFTELLGFRIGNTLGASFHHDLILYSETKQYPYNDFSIAYLADIKNPTFSLSGYDIRNFITFGIGINLNRIIPVRGDLTTPHSATQENLYSRDTISSHFDTLTQSTVYDVKDKWTTFAGTKVMGRVTIDLKGVFPDNLAKLFGHEDVKIYSEIAVLGVQNYPVFFEQMSQRTPVTLGFNWPAFNFFDILNTELEYLYSPYINSIREPAYQLIPIPLAANHEYLKWSIYAKKTIGKRMIISAQVANDHLMPKSSYDNEIIQDYTDVTLRHGDWWWNVRVRFDF